MPSESLLAFCSSRLGLISYALDINHNDLPTTLSKDGLIRITRYSVQHALFYQADFFVSQEPMVSGKAAEEARGRYPGDPSLWGKRRAHLMDLERQLEAGEQGSYSGSNIIYEHVVRIHPIAPPDQRSAHGPCLRC